MMTSKTREVECLVIGGGLAGAMAGLRLARAGRNVLLVEREHGRHGKVCGEFLSAEALAYLRGAGVDPLQLGAAHVQRLRLAAGAQVVQTELPFAAQSLSRAVLDAELLTRAAEQRCAIMRGLAVMELAREGSNWGATLSDGSRVRAGNVFLASGKHDLRGWARPAGVQNDLIGFKMHLRLRREQIASLRGSIDLFLFAGGYGGIVLVEEDLANLCIVVRRETFAQSGRWPQLLARISGECRQLKLRLDGAIPVWERPLAIAPIPYGFIARDCDGLWRLGDQAVVIPSFTGDGMAIALHSAATAADLFLAGASTEAYQRVLAAQLQRGVRIATLMSRLMTTGFGRTLAPAVLGILPPVLRWLAQSTRIPGKALPAHAMDWGTEEGAASR